MSSRCICETSWRRFEDVLKMSWQDVLKMSWRRLEDVLKTSWRSYGKTSWRRLEDVLKAYGQDKYIGLDQDVLKTSFEDEDEERLQDVFIKTNVCWAKIYSVNLRIQWKYGKISFLDSWFWHFSGSENYTVQKFSIKDFFIDCDQGCCSLIFLLWPNPQLTAVVKVVIKICFLRWNEPTNYACICW